MSSEKRPFVNVDELLPQLSLQQAASFYGVELPTLRQVGSETRVRCFLACGRTRDTGDRALAIQAENPVKPWHCHEYGCGKGGNLVSLCDLMKPGANMGGRPRGERFKQIAADMQAMVQGTVPAAAPGPTTASPAPTLPAPPEERKNMPLAQSPNERARALTDLDAKFLCDLARMTPSASGYLRRRPFLSPEVMVKWRAGYLARDTDGDKSGGTMRGRIVYGYRSEAGDILTWFGREPEFEEKHRQWEAGGKVEREPEKFHFVKGFHRGLELFGQHQLYIEETRAQLRGLGLPLVEGPNDVIRLDTLGIPAVGLCSNTITREQAAKAAHLARVMGGGIVTLFLDCDPQGENGMKQALHLLAQQIPVRLGWSSEMYGGRFRGRQPESLTEPEWDFLREQLTKGMVSALPV